MKIKYIIILSLILTLFAVQATLCSNTDAELDKHYNSIKNGIHNPHELNKVPKPFRIIALSFTSEGLKNLIKKDSNRKDEICKLLNTIADLSISYQIAPYKNILHDGIPKNSEYGLYLSHLNIILSNYYHITKNTKYISLQKTINQYLINKTENSNDLHIKAYPYLNSKFLADQAAVIYSIWLYDKVYETEQGRSVIDKWFTHIEQYGMNSSYNLPVSEITNNLWYSKFPRGCATPYFIYYINYITPKKAESLWKNYKLHFMGNFGSFVLFKEWIAVKDNNRYTTGLKIWGKKYGTKGDDDSGPIISGYGAAATGISLLASKSVGDKKVHNSIYYSINTGYFLISTFNKNYNASLNNLLTESIIFAALAM